MSGDYLHVEVETIQSSKKADMPCGDVISVKRNNYGTVIICADGIGSGIKAHIAAQMCVARFFESLERGLSFRQVFSSVASTMERMRDPSKPFVAFSVARIRPDGNATILSYDAPSPLLLGRTGASLLANRPFPLHGGLAFESNIQLDIGEGIILMSDGVTQAGLGFGAEAEWKSEGVIRLVNECVSQRMKQALIPQKIHQEAIRRWSGITDGVDGRKLGNSRRKSHSFSPYPLQPTSAVSARSVQVEGAVRSGALDTIRKTKVFGDDVSVVLAYCRTGQIVNILTGPPSDKSKDSEVIRQFIESKGLKIVCGGTTAELVAKFLRIPLEIEREPSSLIAPPRYGIRGINLVTEGAVTLNQVYNILGEDVTDLDEDNGPTVLRLLLNVADRVDFIVGGASNTANQDIAFRQSGVLSRKVLIPLLVEKLEQDGKLVNVRYV